MSALFYLLVLLYSVLVGTLKHCSCMLKPLCLLVPFALAHAPLSLFLQCIFHVSIWSNCTISSIYINQLLMDLLATFKAHFLVMADTQDGWQYDNSWKMATKGPLSDADPQPLMQTPWMQTSLEAYPLVMWPVMHAGEPTYFPLWTEWHMLVKILPCSKLCLWTVTRKYSSRMHITHLLTIYASVATRG